MSAGRTMFETFIELWKALPKTVGNVPAKTCFSPTLAPGLIPNFFMAEHKARYDLEVRLLGTEIEARPSFRISGENLFDRLQEHERNHFEAFLHAYRQQPCAARVKRRVTAGGGRIYDLHTLGAPLADACGEIRWIMGVAYAETNVLESTDIAENEGARRTHSGREAGGRAAARAHPTIREAEFIDLGFGVPALALDHFNHPH